MGPDWNKRFAEPGFAYGSEPNEFLVSQADRLPPGPVLSLAEGEGRNAVYLAKRGISVTAVDQSAVGLAKAATFADEQNVDLKTIHADLGEFEITPGAWAGIVSIFCHIPLRARQTLHRAVVAGLQPGGILLLEAYTPRQCDRSTGGPATPELTMTLNDLREELSGLEFLDARETDRIINEGAYHTGIGSVVQVVARRDPST